MNVIRCFGCTGATLHYFLRKGKSDRSDRHWEGTGGLWAPDRRSLSAAKALGAAEWAFEMVRVGDVLATTFGLLILF